MQLQGKQHKYIQNRYAVCTHNMFIVLYKYKYATFIPKLNVLYCFFTVTLNFLVFKSIIVNK
jgi:hypothetical protein